MSGKCELCPRGSACVCVACTCTATGAHTRRGSVCVCVAPQTRLFPHSTRTFYLASLFLCLSLVRVCSGSPPYERDSGALQRTRRMERTRCVRVCVRPPSTHVSVYTALPPCVVRRRPLVASFRYQRETSLSFSLSPRATRPLTVLLLLYATLSLSPTGDLFFFFLPRSPPRRLPPLLPI